MNHPTKQRLLDAGMAMLLKHGYNDLGIQALLAATGIPKGSFYHHFRDKEDFALQAIGQYMGGVHEGLDVCLADQTRALSTACVISSRRRRRATARRATWAACWAGSDRSSRE